MGARPRGDIEEVRVRLRAAADPRAARMAKTATRSPLKFHGALPPQVRAIARLVARRHKGDRDLSRVLAAARVLWRSGWHEERTVAVLMVAALVGRVGPDHWNEFKGWLRTVRSADHCDGIAVDLLGSLVKRDRSWLRVLKNWALSENPWERRAAAGAVLLRTRQMGDAEAGLEVCSSLMEDRASVVQEAVSALLREALAVNRPMAEEFLSRWRPRARPAILSAVSENQSG